MKIFTQFLLVGLLVWSSYSTIGFGVVGPFSASAFTCLHSSVPGSVKSALIRVYQNSEIIAGIDPNGRQTLANAWAAGYVADPYVQICRGIDAASQISSLNEAIITPLSINPPINGGFGGHIYVKVEPSSNLGCAWSFYSQWENCNFLRDVVDAIKNIGWPTVIFSTAPIWKQFFGSNCDTFAADTGAYLWYANYDSTGNVDSTQSFDDFVQFGGWSLLSQQVLMKQVAGNVTIPLLCGPTAWHGFVDQTWKYSDTTSG